MSDGISGTPGVGIVIAADDIGGSQYQRIKLVHGVDGVNNGDVAPSNALPVALGVAIEAQFQYAVINYNTLGDKTLVAGSGGTYVRVYGVFLWVAAIQTMYLQDTTPTALMGATPFGAGGKMEFPIIGRPYWKLGVGLGLGLHIVTDAIQVGGVVFYTQNSTP